jgi:hypothetical protein
MPAWSSSRALSHRCSSVKNVLAEPKRSAKGKKKEKLLYVRDCSSRQMMTFGMNMTDA